MPSRSYALRPLHLDVRWSFGSTSQEEQPNIGRTTLLISTVDARGLVPS
jgi:hypothetical protein